MRFKGQKFLSDLWFKEYMNKGLCGLCGNNGILDTRMTAISPAGFNSGGIFYCICPNGRCMKQAKSKRSKRTKGVL